jgi:RIO kinase 2
VLIGASALKHLKKPMLRILQAIERGMITSQYVDVDIIAKYTGFNLKDTEYWLTKCHKLDLIARWTGHFVGFELTIHGYDALALNALYEQKHIANIGNERGVGKESVVYFVQTPEGEERLIKLHRVGYTSFQQVRKKRRYTASKQHISPLYSSRLSAEEEFRWLEYANELELPVPKVYAKNRHVIVMDFSEGFDLLHVTTVDEPDYIFDQIMDFIDIAWNKGGFVHGDISEFNVIVNEDANITIIDFPQAIEAEAEEAKQLLMRDITNITTYFNRQFRLKYEPEALYTQVTSQAPPEMIYEL